MAVLVEAISVVVRRDAIDRAYAGGWGEFVRRVPNATLCTDGELARVGFMSPGDTEQYVRGLEARGLVFMREGQARDLVVVDQQRGPTTPCEWIEFARLPFSPGGPGAVVATCWLYEEPRIGVGIHLKGEGFTLVTPDGWEYEDSLSHHFTWIPIEEVDRPFTAPSPRRCE